MIHNSASVLDDSYNYEDLDIFVVDFVKENVSPSCNVERTRSKYCDLTYIVDGRAVCYVNGKPFLLNKGDFVYIPHEVAYTAYADRRERLSCHTLIFDYAYWTESYRELPFPTIFNVESNVALNDLYEQMGKIWEEKARGYRLMARAIALQIFHDLIFRTYHKYSAGIKSNRVEIVKDYVHKHYQQDIQLEDVADILNLNPVYIGSYFKKKTGYTVRQYINCVRINKAKSILMSGKYSVSEAAGQCGYHDIYYFSKVFKQIEGVSPSYFQK